MRADYDLAVSESIKALHDYGYNEVPIVLNKILRALNRSVKTCSYTKFSIQTGLTIEDICDYFESDLGACAYDHKRERYIIYYNDTKMNTGLTRFTIAHELGHIFLQHHRKADTDIMLRKGISAGAYKRFENEANCFARNFLSPQPLVISLADASNCYSITEVSEAFNISYDAATARINFLSVDGYRIQPEHKVYFGQYNLLYGYYCMNCKSAEAGHSQYCKICGEENSVFVKGVDRLIYGDGVELDENMKVLKCPLCDNEDFSENAEHCKICGTKVYNYCLGQEIYDYNGNFDDRIYHKNPSNARFCETCGNKTEFFQNKLLKPWDVYQNEINDFLGVPDDSDNIPF